MEIISVIAAAFAAFLYGAVHYTVLAKPWLKVSGVKLDENGKPVGQMSSAMPFILSGIAMLLVAGMMRHILAMSGIEGIGKSTLVGLGIGAFFISPWTMINNAYPGRPFKLTVIDAGYAIVGCGLIGLVLAVL